MKTRVLLTAFALLASASSSFADDGLRDLCADRPGRGTSACTVDAGHFQLEGDIFNASFLHQNGVTTDIYFVTNPNLKYGVTDTFDVEANISPLVIVRTRVEATGVTTTDKGIGDLFLHFKWAAIGNGGSDFALVLEPYLKIPTAPLSIGNGAVEGGLVVPISWALPDGWSIGTTPELDILKDAAGNGRHASLTEVIGLSKSIGSGVTLGTEVWWQTDFDPQGTDLYYSFDLDAAWIPESTPNMQFDAGVNFALNRNTPGAQVYLGVSRRF